MKTRCKGSEPISFFTEKRKSGVRRIHSMENIIIVNDQISILLFVQ